MLKLIYLAKRKVGFTPDEFVRRWRMHGAKGMALPLWRFALGYVQAEPIRPAPVASASAEFDAVGYYMVREDMFTGMGEDDFAGSVQMAADELETFSAPISNTSLWVNEQRIKAGELGGITAFLFLKSEATAVQAARRACAISGVNRITLNVRAESVLGPNANTLPYEAVLELAASSIPALVNAIEVYGPGLLSIEEHCLVTREAVLWDRLQ
jgi:hypothetical protein